MRQSGRPQRGLGKAVRRLRNEKEVTQEVLAEKASYRYRKSIGRVMAGKAINKTSLVPALQV